MTRDDVVRLLRRRSALVSQPYSDDVADAWLDVLRDVNDHAAQRALSRAVADGHARVTAAHILERVPGASSSTRHTDPLGNTDCSECEGTGLSYAVDPWDIERAVACSRCRPGEHNRDMAHVRAAPEPTWTLAWRATHTEPATATVPVNGTLL